MRIPFSLLIAIVLFFYAGFANPTPQIRSTEITNTCKRLEKALSEKLPILADQVEAQDVTDQDALNSLNTLIRKEAAAAFQPLMNRLQLSVVDGEWDKQRWCQILRSME